MKTIKSTLFDFGQTMVNEPVKPYLTIPEFTMQLSYKQKPSERYTIINSLDTAKVLRLIIGDGSITWYESFVAIALTRGNKVLNYYRISQGGVTGTIADPKIILQFALACNASSLIICHNHPSGNTKPSRADEELTKKIKHAAEYLDIKLLDHIIVTEDNYYSFADEGLL
jgi:DNA repair protein RadC